MSLLKFITFFSSHHLSSNMYYAKFILKKPVNAMFFGKTRLYSSNNLLRDIFRVNKRVFPAFQINMGNFRKVKINPVCLRISIGECENLRYFHTSEHRYIHPILWTIFRPLMKLMAVITGRALRKWWRDLPPNKKKFFLERMKENKNKIIIFALASIALSVTYYLSHIEETPITKRKRFIAFNSNQLEKINQFEFQQLIQQMYKNILPTSHPSTRRVQAVVDRILLANWDIEEMKDKKWAVAVINSSEENAFVLPNGYVCVFSGMLSLCSTDDELGIILSHEIAHCIQNHGAEKISLIHLLDLISILIIGAIWAVIPSDSLSLLTHWLYSKAMKIFFELPYNRKIETEADMVGLKLAAKACFDVRESSAFWAKMAFLEQMKMMGTPIEFLSTHPSHESRSEYLDTLMDKAIKYRSESGCPKLKPVDPRLNIEIMAKVMDATRQKYLQQFPKPVSSFHF